MRLILLILLVVVAIWFVRRMLRGAAHKNAAEKPPVAGELVSCARCGMHLPRSEAREAAGALYCSEEHARLGAGGG
jgi:uncharacterized protein